MLQQRHSEFLTRPSNDILLNTTYIVGFKETAEQINRMICNILPVPDNKFLISQAIDIVDSIQWNTSLSNQSFKSRTNLPPSVRLQPGACIMYLNNSLIEQGICNSTVGIITDVNPTEESVQVTFSIRGFIININIYKQTHYFELNGNNCQCTQFPF